MLTDPFKCVDDAWIEDAASDSPGAVRRDKRPLEAARITMARPVPAVARAGSGRSSC